MMKKLDIDRTFVIYPEIDKDRCIECGRCYVSCFDGGHQAYTYDEETREITLNKDKCVFVIYPEIDKDRCIECGRCYVSCFDGGHQAYTYDEETREITLNKDKCVGCHLCSLVCPVGAIGKGEIMYRDGNVREIVM